MGENSTIVDFSCLCRLCALETCLSKGMDIYKEEESSKEIKKKIKILLPVQITLSDSLPKMICNECIKKLDTFYQFREKTIQTEQFLTDILNKINKVNFVNEEHKISSSETLHQNVDPGNNDDVYNDNTILGPSETKEVIFSEECNAMTEQNLNIIHSQQNDDIYINEVKSETFEEKCIVKCEDYNNQKVIIEGQTQFIEDTEQFNKKHVRSADTIDKHTDTNNENVIVEEQLNEIFMKLEPQPIVTDNEAGCDIQTVYYFCNICTDTYETKNKLIEHYQTHWFKCHLCTSMFRDETGFQIHMKSVHDQIICSKDLQNNDESENYIEENCNENDIETENKNNVLKHSKKNITNKSSQKVCKTCGKSYRSNYKLNEHMRKHTGEQPFKCQTCMKGFRSKIGLAQHEATHTGVYDYFCPTCGKGFQCRSYLAVHQRVHSDAKPYPCITCERQFKSKQSLLDHMNRHLGVKPYICNICGKGFITKGLCKSHQKVHSGSDNRQYPCPVCKKLFVSKSYLATHARIHTGEKPFICEVCAKGFLTRVDLRIHSTVHTGEKSFICETCGKAFARKDALRCHRRSHTGERPYICDVCGQSFTQFTPMAIHKRLHTGERPYECDVCLRTFVSRSTMMAHRKKHDP